MAEKGDAKRPDWRRHLPPGLLAVVLLLLPLGLEVEDETAVHVRGLSQWPLPTMCWLRNAGWECPTCGLTRSWIFLVRGQPGRSLQQHPLGWLVFLVLASQVPLRLWCLYRRRDCILPPPWGRRFGAALVGVFLLNWLIEAC